MNSVNQKQIIFLTGATGRIGRALLKDIVDGDYQIVVLSHAAQTTQPLSPKIRYIHGDISEPSSYAAGLKDTDIVVHMAAVTHTNKIDRYYDINSVATDNLIKKCREYGVKRFIFISTRAISKGGGDYSKSKSIAERYVRESGLDWVILRLSEVYGINGGTVVDRILNEIERFPFIPIIGRGDYKIAPVHISDVLYAIERVIKENGIKNRVYNIAGPETFTFEEFIDRVLKIKNIKKAKIYIPKFLVWACAYLLSLFPKNDFFVIDQLPRFFCEKDDDISLAAEELGFKPITLEEQLNYEKK